MQNPRIFGRGHIGRGWTNIAPFFYYTFCPGMQPGLVEARQRAGLHPRIQSESDSRLEVSQLGPGIHLWTPTVDAVLWIQIRISL